jgi:serine/threonine protein kinase
MSFTDVLVQMIEAVEEMHSYGFVHNDIKLDNYRIMKNRVVLIDFGLTDRYLEKAYKGEKIEENVIKIICSKVREILSAEDNVQNLKSPITLVGDVHG